MAPGRKNDPDRDPPPVDLPIGDALDLHAFHPRDVPVVVAEFLWEAARRRLSEVRIIHGKGIGVQRRIVAAALERHPAVLSFSQAPANRGHWGATIVKLREGIERPGDVDEGTGKGTAERAPDA